MALFAELFGHGLEPRRIARSDDDPGALLCHGARHGFADAGAAARDQRYPSRKIHSLFTFSPPRSEKRSQALYQDKDPRGNRGTRHGDAVAQVSERLLHGFQAGIL